MTNGEKMVWAAAFALIAADERYENEPSKDIARRAGAVADEAVRLLRVRAEYDAEAKEMTSA